MARRMSEETAAKLDALRETHIAECEDCQALQEEDNAEVAGYLDALWPQRGSNREYCCPVEELRYLVEQAQCAGLDVG